MVLDAEQRHLEAAVESVDYRVVLFECVRETDLFWASIKHKDKLTENEEITSTRFKYGMPLLLRIIFSKLQHVEERGPIFPSEGKFSRFCNSIVAAAGDIEAARRIANLVSTETGEIVRVSPYEFHVRVPADFRDLDSHENEVYTSLVAKTARHQNESLLSIFDKYRVDRSLDDLLAENVHIWEKKFIGYDAHPLIDEYFFALAYSRSYLLPDFDTFHRFLKFGGIEFQKYIIGAISFLSFSMKHGAFCFALLEKHPKIKIENILTVTGEKETLLLNLKDAINEFGQTLPDFTPATRQDVETIYKVLSLSKDNVSVIKNTGAAFPFVIDYTDRTVVKSIAGASISPFSFLLNSLRHYFPKDYDKNQRTREESMVRALTRVLVEKWPSLRFSKNLKIRRGRRIVTDIDYLVWDAEQDVIFLFQLKHHDLYGSDMRRRRNTAERIRRSVTKWVNDIQEWIAGSAINEIKASLQIKKSINISKEKIYTIILIKYNAHFLSSLDLPNNTCYCTWYQYISALEELNDLDVRPKALFDRLSESMTHKKADSIGKSEPYSCSFRNLKYTIFVE